MTTPLVKSTIEVEGFDELMKKFKKMEDIIKALAPVMLEIAQQLEFDAKQFVTGRTPIDEWQRKATQKYNPPAVGMQGLGVVDDRLRPSIKGILDKITEEYIDVLVGSKNVEYAAIHELGGIIKKATGKTITMPSRPYLYPALLKNEEWIKEKMSKTIMRLAK